MSAVGDGGLYSAGSVLRRQRFARLLAAGEVGGGGKDAVVEWDCVSLSTKPTDSPVTIVSRSTSPSLKMLESNNTALAPNRALDNYLFKDSDLTFCNDDLEDLGDIDQIEAEDGLLSERMQHSPRKCAIIPRLFATVQLSPIFNNKFSEEGKQTKVSDQILIPVTNLSPFSIYDYILCRQYEQDLHWHNRDPYLLQMLQSLSTAISVHKSFQLSCHNLSKGVADSKQRVIVLDLDETVVHAEAFNFGTVYSKTISVTNLNGQNELYGLHIRPHTTNFLESLALQFRIVVFTASIADYAQKVVQAIDPEGKYISGVLSRDDCDLFSGLYIKNLSRIGHASPDNVLIVDNHVHSYSFHIDQGIPIKPFYSDMNDNELLRLKELLLEAHTFPTLKQFMQKRLGLPSFYKFLSQQLNKMNLAKV